MPRKKKNLKSNPSTSTTRRPGEAATAINNDLIPFLVTLGIYDFLQKFYELGIHPIIVVDPRLPRNWKSLSLDGLTLCGCVFLKWDGWRLERLLDRELKSLGIELPKSLKDSIDANWGHFDAHKINTVASSVESVPSYTTRVIDVDFFEFSTPKAKWTVLGSRNMVDVNCDESEPNFARKCFNSLLGFFSRVGEIDSNILKSIGIPVAIDIKKYFDLTAPIMATIYCGVVFFLLFSDMSKRSSLARCLNGVASCFAVAHIFWKELYNLPPPYLLCFLLCVCAIFFSRIFWRW